MWMLVIMLLTSDPAAVAVPMPDREKCGQALERLLKAPLAPVSAICVEMPPARQAN